MQIVHGTGSSGDKPAGGQNLAAKLLQQAQFQDKEAKASKKQREENEKEKFQGQEANKRFKSGKEDGKGGAFKKTELKVTKDMFEAARNMPSGVAHIKDLDMSLAKRAQTVRKAIGNCQVTLIDIFTGEVTVKQQTRPLKPEHARFDFNSEDDFTADADSTLVAEKAWNWVLNPIGIDTFKKEIKDKQVMIIQNREGFTYSQDDPDQDMLSLQNFRSFMTQIDEQVKQGAAGAQEIGEDGEQIEPISLKYGKDVDVVKFINGKRHTINPAVGTVDADLLFDFFDNQKCSIRLSRPHEFSSSLAKMLCLGDEIFESDTGVNAYITPYPTAVKKSQLQDAGKQEQGFAPHYDDIDAFLLQLEGKKHWNLFKPQQDRQLLDLEPSSDFSSEQVFKKLHKYWSGTLGEGDVLYMPRGVIHCGKTSPSADTSEEHQHSLHVTLSNQQHNSWIDLVDAGFKQTIKKLTAQSLEFRSALPSDIFSNSVQAKREYQKMVKKLTEKMTSEEAVQEVFWKWQSRFMFRRQAPQEILKPGNEAAEDEQEEVKDAFAKNIDKDSDLSDQSDDDAKDSSEDKGSDSDMESGEDEKDEEAEEDFSQVKLVTKHAAFLRKRDEPIGKGKTEEVWYIHYSTQNERSQQMQPRQKVEVPTQFVEALQFIMNSYPDYCSFEDIPNFEIMGEELAEYLAELATLQIFVVQ